MDPIENVDFRNYTQGCGVAASYAKAVARQLVNASPADASDGERAALERAVAAADAIEAILWERTQRAPAQIAPLRTELARSASALFGALTSLSAIAQGDRGARARAIVVGVFPDGVAFVQGDAYVGWSEATRRLGFVEERRLSAEIAAVLGGPELLVQLEAATAALGAALGLGDTPRPITTPSALRSARQRYSRAVAAYCRVLAATVHEDDPASVARFMAAVAPLDEYRALHARTPAEDPDTDVDVAPPVVVDAPVIEPAPAPA